MANLRLIARLDIKGPNLVKTVQLEGLRVVGNPREYAARYYQAGIDELVYMDIVASLYGRNNLREIVSETTKDVFVPLTVGGGVRSVSDARDLLLAGADKVAVNTAAIRRPELISELAERFGSQCVVISIEAKQVRDGKWECYTDNGREWTGIDVVQWAQRAQQLGAGELMVTSVDREGTRKGFDVSLTRAVSSTVGLPVIASGGMGDMQHCINVARIGQADAIAVADALHFNRMTVHALRDGALAAGLPVRRI